MAFKNTVPQKTDASWGDYWQHLHVGDDVKNCETDGLLPILQKYVSKTGRTLEAGCGLGKWLIFLKKQGFNIEGIDFYDGVIKAIKKYDPSLKVSVGDVEKLPYSNDSLDSYLSFGVVEHWEQGPQKPLQEAFRVLKKGGVAIIETPHNNLLQQLLRVSSELKRLIKLPAKILVETLNLRPKKENLSKSFYEYHYSPAELSSHVSSAGFKILDTKPKDDLAPNRSISLWLDLPKLRKEGASEFELNETGTLLKKLLAPFPWFWSYCVVIIAVKE